MPPVATLVPAETDLLCEGCGYTLNGLPHTSNCPECGKPIEQSLGEHRKLSEFECRPSLQTFLATTCAVVFQPTSFFRALATRNTKGRAAQFAILHWTLAGIFLGTAATAHAQWYWELTGRAFNSIWSSWVPMTTLTVVLLASITFVAARLTTWEARYRGLRLPLAVVLRGMYYHSAHFLPVASLALITVLGNRFLLLRGSIGAQSSAAYLYVLSGEVILVAVYLFYTYWIAMKNMMYANR